MATFKAVVYSHHKRADGTWNIKIRVIHNRKIRYIATNWYVTKDDITKSFKLKNAIYIDYVDDLIKSYRKILDKVGQSVKEMDVDTVCSLIKDAMSRQDPQGFDLDIVAYGRDHAKHLRDTGHEGNARAYEIALNNLVKFVGRDNVSVREINSRFVEKWIEWIGKQPAPKNKVKGSRAQSLYPSQLRAILNLAKKEYNDEDNGIIRIPQSPFKKVSLPKVEHSRSRAISLGQLKMLWNLPDREVHAIGTNRWNFARDVYKISFLLMGMNEGDLYECTDCRNGRITYQRKKTRNRRADNAEISIFIQPELMPLLEKYKDRTGERVFNFHNLYGSINTFSMALNKGLKKIGSEIGVDDLEFYSARHTWATIAVNEAGVDKYSVHQALNHVDEKMKITDIYIKKSWDVIDKANRQLIDYCGI